MLVQVYEFSRDEGTVMVFKASGEDGEDVTFAADRRPGLALLDRMFDPDTGQETAEFNEGVYAEIEPWQILSYQP